MKTMSTRLAVLSIMILIIPNIVGCGGGVPIEMTIDEYTIDLDIDEISQNLYQELMKAGAFKSTNKTVPELWPDSLEPLKMKARFVSDAISVDLTPEEGSEDADKYKAINEVGDAIKRIEFNKVIVRVESSTLNVPLSDIQLQMADDNNASNEDRLAWWTIGTLPDLEKGFIGDLEMTFLISGESFMTHQLSDETKEFAIRITGALQVDTEQERKRPLGLAVLRLITVATFFVAPEEAL